MAKRIKKVVVSTLIIVGEGACEKAFLSHLKQLFQIIQTKKLKWILLMVAHLMIL